ncbi:MAG: YihY/virulence factor BrkB family protein, partial [Desulfobulbaceae bacterium]|nr:YihY/virulence factor BrkB family protein [Desulfobulbaceae bacterium]
LALAWTALQCFATLIVATNRAWGSTAYNWWRLPLKSLVLLGSTVGAVLLGMAVPVLMRVTKSWLFPLYEYRTWVYGLFSYILPSVVVFSGLVLFYRFAPSRPTRFVEVWAAALCATVLLRAGENLFIVYLKDYATLNAVYGTFGASWPCCCGSIFPAPCSFLAPACAQARQNCRRLRQKRLGSRPRRGRAAGCFWHRFMRRHFF